MEFDSNNFSVYYAWLKEILNGIDSYLYNISVCMQNICNETNWDSPTEETIDSILFNFDTIVATVKNKSQNMTDFLDTVYNNYLNLDRM